MPRILMALLGLWLCVGFAQAQEGTGFGDTADTVTVFPRAMAESVYNLSMEQLVANPIWEDCPVSVFIRPDLTQHLPSFIAFRLEYERGSEPPSVGIIAPGYGLHGEEAYGWNAKNWHFGLVQACFTHRQHQQAMAEEWELAEIILRAERAACAYLRAKGHAEYVQAYMVLEEEKKLPATWYFPVDYKTRVKALADCLHG